MMTLADVSGFFDRTPALDPATGEVLFYGQVDPYDDSKRDAGGAYRRILSVQPNTQLPASRAVQVFGVTWLLGRQQIDGLDELHRAKYVMQMTAGLHSISRLTGYLRGTPAGAAHVGIEWVKEGKELEASSGLVSQYDAFLAPGTDVQVHDVISRGTAAYLALSVYEQPAGFLSATVIRLDYPLAVAAVSTRVYDPVAGMYTGGTVVNVPALRVRWQSLFAYAGQLAHRYQEGDDTIVLPAGTTLTTSSTISLAGQKWIVLGVDSLGGAVSAHVRPAWAD